MRVAQTEPQWKLDMYEGNLYFMGRLFRRALSYHMKAYRDKTVNRDPQAKILLLRCLMDDYDLPKQKKAEHPGGHRPARAAGQAAHPAPSLCHAKKAAFFSCNNS